MSPLRVSLLIFASTLSIFLLSGWDVAGVREAIYPVLCLSLLPTILLTVLFRRVITRWDVLLSFLAAQALLLIIFSNERGFALLWCLVMGVIPLLIYLTFRTRWSVLLLGVCVTFDLFFAFHQSNLLYSGVAAPRTRVAKEVAVPFSRAVAPNTPPASERSLFPQYVSLYERKRYAFSAPFRYTEAESKRNSLGETRRTMRWHSYLLLRSYFNYVNSNVSDAQMERDFGLDGPLLRLVRARDGVGVKGQIRVEEVSSGRLVVDVKVSESAALYFSDSHDPYWRARVNDIAQPVFKVGGQFKAVKLDVGSHRVVFSYEPFLFYWGMLFYFSGIVSLLANTALPHFFNSVQGRRQYIGFPAPA